MHRLHLKVMNITFQPTFSAVGPSFPRILQSNVNPSLIAFLLTKLLTSILERTAKNSSPGSVRVTWPASALVKTGSPKHGVRKELLQDSEAHKKLKISETELYSSTKAASYFLASEFARCQQQPETAGVIHLAGNPGNYVTGVWKDVGLLPLSGHDFHHSCESCSLRAVPTNNDIRSPAGCTSSSDHCFVTLRHTGPTRGYGWASLTM